jgi:hypothetical protein
MEGKSTLRLFPVQSFDCAQDKRTGAVHGLRLRREPSARAQAEDSVERLGRRFRVNTALR